MTSYDCIYPMMIELDKTIENEVYYLSLPEKVKKAWVELEEISNPKFSPEKNLPTVTFKKIMLINSDGIIEVNPVSKYTDDIKWLISFKSFKIKEVVECFKIWIEEFYIKGEFSSGFRDDRKYGENNDKIKEYATKFKNSITTSIFNNIVNEKMVLFKDGKVVSKEAYKLFPLKVVDSLIGKSVYFDDKETKLLYSNYDEITTGTNDFYHKNNKNDFISFVIKLSLQTLPPHNKVYLNVRLSSRRWISNNYSEDGKNYISNSKNCYIRTSNDKLQVIRAEYNKKENEIVWKNIDLQCYNSTHKDSLKVKFTEVMKCPKQYNNGQIGDVLIPYEDGINDVYTNIKAGVTFNDRENVFNIIKHIVTENEGINSKVEASRIKISEIKDTAKRFIKKGGSIDKGYFKDQLNKALDGENLIIEIHSEDDKIKKLLFNKINEFLETDSKYKIEFCEQYDLLNRLEKKSLFNNDNKYDDNLFGFEKRIEKIKQNLKKVNDPVISFIVINDKEYFNKLDLKCNVDPKKALRCGFAETGRLTQFITIEQFYKEDEEGAKKVNLDKILEHTVLDGFRQIGVVFDYSLNKKIGDKKIVGIHIVNYKSAFFDRVRIPPFPIIVTYDVKYSKVLVYCDLIDKVNVPYWKAILALSRLSYATDIKDRIKIISSTTLLRRLDRLINKDESDVIIIVDANGTSRKFFQGISNSEIERGKINKYNQLDKILIHEDKFLDLSSIKKNVSIVRTRHNEEVPSYITMDRDNNKSKVNQSGIFKYDKVYYSIDSRPQHEYHSYIKSKLNKMNYQLSHRHLIEIYPLFISGNERNIVENEINSISIVHILRSASIQFTSQKTILPLPLHLAEKMEEVLE